MRGFAVFANRSALNLFILIANIRFLRKCEKLFDHSRRLVHLVKSVRVGLQTFFDTPTITTFFGASLVFVPLALPMCCLPRYPMVFV